MNKFCNLYGENKIKDDYTKINDGFQLVQEALETLSSFQGQAVKVTVENTVVSFNQVVSFELTAL